MNDYINDNFDTGFLSPHVNFGIFCLSWAAGLAGLILRIGGVA